MGKYAKAIVAVLGAGAGAALAIFAPHTMPWDVAEILVAVATTAGVFGVSNGPTPPVGVTGTKVNELSK